LPAFRLAHISDVHLPPPPTAFRVRDLVSKRLLSRFAWARKKHRRHRREVVDALAADIRAQGVDHLAITGDLTNFPTPEEFAQASDWLTGLGPTEDVTVSPGNHDALVERGVAPGLTAFRPWLGDAGDGFPYVRVRGPVAFINLSTATATPILSAQGTLGAAQIGGLAGLLRQTAAEGLYRVVLLHHPAAAGVVSKRKSLTDAAELRAVLKAAGCDLILHGHAHEALLTSVDGPSGPIPALGVPSASTPTGLHDEPARWNLIEISRTAKGFETRVQARGLTEGLTVGQLGAFSLA
jgi:3',5'-cyclic AMP phosphodiesterase CpdA